MSTDPKTNTNPVPRAAQWQLVVAIAGLGAAIITLCLFANHFDFINDDAFISFRYADNLVRHGELTFNPGQRVEGYTNFLWTMVVAGVLLVGWDPVVWSKVLGVVCGCGTLTAVFFFARWWTSDTPDNQPATSPLWWVVAPLYLAANPSFACWSEGGLETGLFTLLLTVGVLRYVVEFHSPQPKNNHRWPISGAVLALAAMTRPEGLMVIGLLGLHRLAVKVLAERSFRPTQQELLWCAGFGIIYVPYWVWRYAYYGFPLPNTYYAKAGRSLWGPGGSYVLGFVADYHLWVLLPLLLLPWRGRPRAWRLWTATIAVTVPYGVYVAKVGGDFMALHRFLVPLLPLLTLVAAECLRNLWALVGARIRQSRGWQARVGIVCLLLVATLGWQHWQIAAESLAVGSKGGVDSIGWLKQFVGQTTAIGKYLRANNPNDSLATTAAGVIPYYSRMKTLDLLGLNDTHTAHNVPARGNRPGHAKSAPEDYVLRWKPTLLIWHPRMSKHRPYPRRGERQYWLDRGYEFRFAEVPGLEPPHWAWFQLRDASD